jgi:hypothetical protein
LNFHKSKQVSFKNWEKKKNKKKMTARVRSGSTRPKTVKGLKFSNTKE